MYIREIVREFNKALGNKFALFYNETISNAQLKDLSEKNKTTGIVYWNNGTLELLEGNQGLQGSGEIVFRVKVEETSEQVNIESDIKTLLNTTNGFIQTQGNGANAFKYVVEWSVPTPASEIYSEFIENTAFYFQNWVLPFRIVISNNISFGNETDIYLSETLLATNNIEAIQNARLGGKIRATLSYTARVDNNNQIGKTFGGVVKINGTRQLEIIANADGGEVQGILKKSFYNPAQIVYVTWVDATDIYYNIPMIVVDMHMTATQGGFDVINAHLSETSELNAFTEV